MEDTFPAKISLTDTGSFPSLTLLDPHDHAFGIYIPKRSDVTTVARIPAAQAFIRIA